MEYILSNNVTKDLLINNGFREITYKDAYKTEYEYIYIKSLNKRVYMSIAITLSKDKFSLSSIRIINDDLGILYKPFYSNESSIELDNIINNYNNEMNKLIDLGIFKKNEKVLKKEM